LVLSEVRVDVSDMETFVAESIRPGAAVSGQATLGINAGNIELTATIRNDSDQLLENATLLIGSYAVKLGDLAPGAEVSTTEIVGAVSASGVPSFSPTGYGSPLMANANAILDTNDYYNDREAYPRWQLLQALEDDYLAGGGTTPTSRVTLLAWSDAPQLETAVQNHNHNSYATTLYLLDMPVQSEWGGSLTVPINLLNWTILGSNNMYSESIQDFYLPDSAWMEVEFTPWPELASLAVADVAVHLSSQTRTSGQPVPSVRLWDWQADEWVDVDGVVWGETAVPNPQRFLTDDNTIRLRLQNKGAAGLDIEAFYPLLTGKLE
jgi:hypothetical protein